MSVAALEMLCSDGEGCGFDLVGCEEGGGAGGLIGHGYGEVEVAAGLESGLDGGEAEAEWERVFRQREIVDGDKRILHRDGIQGAGQFEEVHPQGLKPHCYCGFLYGLKPVPFN